MTRAAFVFWGLFCTWAIVFAVFLFGGTPRWWWTIPLGFAVGAVFGRLQRRYGQ